MSDKNSKKHPVKKADTKEKVKVEAKKVKNITKTEVINTKTKAVEPKPQKIETSKKKLANDKIKEENVVATSVAEAEILIPNSELLDTAEPQVQLAKAGKHSAKALREAEEKAAKEERKAKGEAAAAAAESKPAVKPTRTRLERAGKKLRQAAENIDRSKDYSLTEALELATKTSTTKFDSTVELHLNLNVDPKQADQNIRGTVVLPAGTGKPIRVAVLAEADDAAKALKAGAEIAGSDDLFKDLDKEKINFDVLIAAPAMMQKLSKYARLLGPRGLMPNPKSGTVAQDVVKAVSEAKAGRVEFRLDSNGIVHSSIGKVSFGADKLSANAEAILASIRAAKPASIKSVYFKSLHISTTMGPSIRVKT